MLITTSNENSVKIDKCKLSSGLYIVATPIGNLKDITLRALETLQSADIIICEDSRVTNKLLSHYDIKASMQIYSDHTGADIRPKIIQYIKEGQAVALVSDAGTPLISDPGYKLVREVQDADLYVTTIPGANAAISALTIASLPTDSFLFAGFLAAKSHARKNVLQKYLTIDATLVFYQRASRVYDSLLDIKDIMGDREISIIREITKRFEEVKNGNASELIDYYHQNGNPKGEVVIIISGDSNEVVKDEEIDDLLQQYFNINGMSLKDTVAKVSAEYNISRKIIYERALQLFGK